MKIWYDKNKLDLDSFKSEKFLFLPLFDINIIKKDNDFKNNLEWSEQIKDIVSYTTKEEADIIVFHDKLNQEISNYIEEEKPVLIFYNDDNDKPISSKLPNNFYIFRTSFYKSLKSRNEIALPAWSEDFKDYINVRSKNKVPIVSFCGAITHPVRSTAINQLQNKENIKTNFIIRNQFWAGAPHNKQARMEYIENIKHSDLVLCCRGAGNFSFRLYETLSMGKIPIIVNTDLCLPCDDVIEWDRFIVTSDNNIVDSILKFWSNTTKNEYIELQDYSRKIYDEYISPSGFTNYISTRKW